MKLVEIIPSSRADKKLMAIFKDDKDKIKKVHFGARGYRDYPYYFKNEGSIYAKKKRDGYLTRHSVREDWNDPTTAGALSRFILWNKPSIEESIHDFRKRFKLW